MPAKVTHSIAIKPKGIERMKRDYPLFADNLAETPKKRT
jgi:hypothetical protein